MTLLHLLLSLLQPRFVLRVDRREFEGYRYTSVCALEYQRPETMMCIEVPR
jgi:hypothetical protein